MDDFQEKPKIVPVIPEFFSEPVRMEFKSKAAGRPVFEDQEFVRVIIPGDRNSITVQPVNEEVIARWPKEYEAFKAGLEMPLEGTPLEQWPPVSRAQVREFAHFNVRTVEQLAAINDVQIQHMGMGVRELQRAAKIFLDAARNGTGPLLKLVADNERMKLDAEASAKTIADLAARIEAMEAKSGSAQQK